MEGRINTSFHWFFTNLDEVLDKLESKGFLASSLSIYAFFPLYATLPHNLAEEKLRGSVGKYPDVLLFLKKKIIIIIIIIINK